ncbi:MAG: type IV pilus assembly protein PilM [Candidatus Kerfeldbacteria bacterium]|nr:type IV pilus assembly protein PilM [Candidatus Kerfeldbacteria bacterium]
MAQFNPKQSFVGIDIGTSSIKAVQLAADNQRPRLMTYGYLEQSTDIIKNDTPAAREVVISGLKTLIRESKITTNRAVTALPSFTVFSSIISLPLMTRKELNSAVRWEAKKFVPMPIDDLVLDWKLLKESHELKQPAAQTPKNLRVLITAAPKSLVKRYIDIFRAAGLQIVNLETESLALERSLIGTDPAPVMIVDIGAAATDIAVIVDGIPLINRSIDVGGNSMSKSIAQSLNIDQQRAEQFKRDFGLNAGQQSTSQIPKTIEFVMSSIVNEIRFVLNLYRNQNTGPIERIILSGGSAFLLNLPEFLEKTLSIKTFIGDPWARVIYPVELKPALQEIGPRFAAAIGLAMRELSPA